jgi:hypothetical protein
MADRYTRNLEYIAKNMGQDLLPFISSEDRVRDLTPAERLEGLDATERLEGLSLEDRIGDLSDGDRQALRQLLEEQDTDI